MDQTSSLWICHARSHVIELIRAFDENLRLSLDECNLEIRLHLADSIWSSHTSHFRHHSHLPQLRYQVLQSNGGHADLRDWNPFIKHSRRYVVPQ